MTGFGSARLSLLLSVSIVFLVATPSPPAEPGLELKVEADAHNDASSSTGTGCAAHGRNHESPSSRRLRPSVRASDDTAAQRTQAQPARDRARPETGTGVIRGRVFAADSGTPLRRARVSFAALDQPRSATAVSLPSGVTTDGSGRYELRDLPPGRYKVTAKRTGYVQMEFGARRPGPPRTPALAERAVTIELASGESFEGADFYLPRAGAISGRLLDESGEPMINAQVGVSRFDWNGGRRRMIAHGFETTDDQGEFRVWGLPPGSYYVVASAPMHFRMLSQSSSYADALYPGVYLREQARAIAVGPGQEVSGVNFTLMPVRLARVSGTIVTSDGTPPSRASFNVQTSSADSGFTRATVYSIGPGGTFDLRSVVPGAYVVAVQAQTANGASEVASFNLTVMGDDVVGLSVVTGAEGQLTGTVVCDDGARPPSTTMRVVAGRLDGQSEPIFMAPQAAAKRPGTVEADGAFELPVGAEPRFITVAGLPSGWAVVSIRAGDNDVTNVPLEARSGERRAVQIVVSGRAPTLTGSVVDTGGKPTWDYVAVLFAKDPSRWWPGSPLVRTGRPNQSGRFTIAGLQPGTYYLAALEDADEAEWSEPEGLERLRAAATEVVLALGDKKNVRLTVTRAGTKEH